MPRRDGASGVRSLRHRSRWRQERIRAIRLRVRFPYLQGVGRRPAVCRDRGADEGSKAAAVSSRGASPPGGSPRSPEQRQERNGSGPLRDAHRACAGASATGSGRDDPVGFDGRRSCRTDHRATRENPRNWPISRLAPGPSSATPTGSPTTSSRRKPTSLPRCAFELEGTGDPLLLARLMDLTASLYTDQRRFERGSRLLDYVYADLRDVKATCIRRRGPSSARGSPPTLLSIPTRRSGSSSEGIRQIDPARDPKLVLVAVHGLLWCLVDSGRRRRARTSCSSEAAALL